MNNNWIINKLCTVDSKGAIYGIAVNNNNGNIYMALGIDGLWKLNKDDMKPQCIVKDGSYMIGIVWNGNNILYICDINHRILSYSIDTEILSTLAGNGTRGHQDGNIKDATFYHPWGIAMDRNGDLYITEWDRIRKINIKSETVETIAGPTGSQTDYGYQDGETKNAKFNRSTGIVISNDDTIYVCDQYNHCIRQIKNGIVSTIAGIPGKEGFKDGPTNQSIFRYPHGLILTDDGNLLVGDYNGLRIVDMNQKIVSTSQGILHQQIHSLTRDTLGSIYVGCKNTIFHLENTWRWERFLWIGWMKENSNYCLLARLPKEIIKEIASHLSGNTTTRKRTGNTLEDEMFKKQKKT
jgi:DNA-binding beta-propeller fold protein YncE